MSSVICTSIPSPKEWEARYPLSSTAAQFIERSRQAAAAIIKGADRRIALLVGPCSIHSLNEAIEYGARLKELQKQVEEEFFLVMRVFVEKPRTRLGWKGLVYDPYLDGSNDLVEGLGLARKLLVELNECGVPCAMEFLEPLIAVYLSDCISWGMVGARTVASQPHRQMASGLPFPIGFKNGVHGELDLALDGIVAARASHGHFSLDGEGRISMVQTTGNPLAHLVLRGSEAGANSDRNGVEKALQELRAYHLEERLVIDCAHGNSGKNLQKQKRVFEETIAQIVEGNGVVRGAMLESYLAAGKQVFPEEGESLLPGVSITDPCLGWEETEQLLLNASISISSVQK